MITQSPFRTVRSRGHCIGMIALLFSLFSGTSQADVVDAVDRPALTVSDMSKVVFLGAAQSGQGLVAVGERGVIVTSSDGGVTWTQSQVPVSVTLTSVVFADEKHGFAVGHGGIVLATTDAGQTWEKRLDGVAISHMMLDTARSNGGSEREAMAQRWVAEGPDKPLLDVWVENRDHVVVVGAYGMAFESTDGGHTWTSWMDRLDNADGLHLYAIKSKQEKMLIVGEQGLIRTSNDGGRHFTSLDAPYSGSFFTTQLTADGSLFVAGMRGNAWTMHKNGEWEKLMTPDTTSITGSALQTDNTVVLVNQAGSLFSAHGGKFSKIILNNRAPLNAVLALNNDNLLIGQQLPLFMNTGGVNGE